MHGGACSVQLPDAAQANILADRHWVLNVRQTLLDDYRTDSARLDYVEVSPLLSRITDATPRLLALQAYAVQMPKASLHRPCKIVH